MRVSAAKTSPRVERNVYMRQKKIKAYGADNDYPQKVYEILNSSGTGKTCFDIYVKFIEGGGFIDQTLADAIINENGERASLMLTKAAKDMRLFNGFAFLLKYDFSGYITDIYNIPFEHCRLEIDDKNHYTGRVAVHPDWTNNNGLRFKNEDITYIHRYNPDKVFEQIQEVGTPALYAGQVYYYTTDGEFEYPICPFDPVVTDMLTEEAVSTVKHRNAKHNFLPAGILVRKGIKPQTLEDGTIDPHDRYNQEQIQSADEIKRMQGDTNASKIWVVDVDADEEKPEFIQFDAKNYDRQFELTEETVQDNIGRMFMMPPILRGVDVGSGFGADLITNAYEFMNSVVSDERRRISTAFKDMLEFYEQEFNNFDIAPIKYVTENTQPDVSVSE